MNRKRQEWRKKIQKWEMSGKSARAWCLENGIVYTTFMSWRTLLVGAKQKETKATLETSKAFVELAQEDISESNLEMTYQGITIRLFKNFDSDLLLRCIKTLKGLSC